jgi:hypothetical protein
MNVQKNKFRKQESDTTEKCRVGLIKKIERSLKFYVLFTHLRKVRGTIIEKMVDLSFD